MRRSNQGYADEAPRLLRQYESFSFVDAHRSVAYLFPPAPATVLDIGAGTGRDAAGFAALGHRVVAVEPTAALRLGAMALHPSPRIEWVDDALPDLDLVRRRGEVFDLIMLNAVWMHLDKRQRRRAMPRVASLLRPGGTLIMSQRYGPVPPGRRMFAVPAEETIGLAAAQGLRPVLNRPAQPVLQSAGVSWLRLAFVKD